MECKNMQRNAAVYRTEKTLQEGADLIDQIYDSFQDVKIEDKGLVWNTDLIETLELDNLLRNYAPNQLSQNRPFTVLLLGENPEVLRPETTTLTVTMPTL